MEKQEILKKAQQDNKGKDLAELEAQKKGTYIAFTVGGLLLVGVVIVDLIVAKKFQYGVLAGLLAMIATAFITKYVVRRKKHELVVAILYTLMTLAFATLWILQLAKAIS